LSVLRQSGRAVLYTPADISLEMVLSARRTAAGQISGLQCTPLLCDLAECTVLPAILKGIDPSGAERLLLFFGTVHNYWPPDILKAILYPLRSQDWLLLSANLAPAEDYSAALERIMVQYDNEPTRHWLMGALSELDLSSADGELRFSIEAAPDDPAFQRIVADFVFTRRREITLFDRAARFSEGQKLRVFYSWRFTRGIVCKFLQQAGLAIEAEWITPAREEGVFLCRRAGSAEKQLERSVGVEATQ
jgi:hypothetical protein